MLFSLKQIEKGSKQHLLSAEVSRQALGQQRSDEKRVPTKHMQSPEPLRAEEYAKHYYKHKQCPKILMPH